MKKTIIVGISAGIAGYKVAGLIKKLKEEFSVEVVMTKNACLILPSEEVEKAGVKVHKEMFIEGFTYKEYIERRRTDHISLSDKACLFIIAPATADIIGRIRSGIADDLLTTAIMATQAPVILAPSMNCKMWQNPIVQENVSFLKDKGYLFVDPERGELACGYEGVGRLADISRIETLARSVIEKSWSLKGKRVLVTAGGTEEPVDDVRVITNRSSGKMALAFADEAQKRGADVTVVKARTHVPFVGRFDVVEAITIDDMGKAVRQNAAKSDIIIHAAAVGDFLVEKSGGKISGSSEANIRLTPAKKIIDSIKKINPGAYLVGFKAECDIGKDALVKKALKLLQRSGADMVLANDVSGGRVFGADESVMDVVFRDGSVKKLEGKKDSIASDVLDMI